MKTRYRISSALLCLLLLVTLTASAVVVKVTRDASVTLYYNGAHVVCEDEQGHSVLPVRHGGKIYIPLYTMGRMARRELKYDDDTQEIRATSRVLDGYVATKFERPGKDDWNILTPDSTLTKTTEVEASVAKSICVRVTSDSNRLATNEERTVDLLYVADHVYVPIRSMSEYLGMYCDWNTLCHSIEVMTPEFRKAVDDYINTDSIRVPITYSNARGVRDYIYRTYLQDSSSIPYSFTVARKSNGGAECVIDRDKFDSLVAERNENLAQVQWIVDSLELDDKSDKEKLRLICKYICTNYDYDKENMYTNPARTLSQVLNTDKTVCEGFARMFMMMCRSAGIQCQYLLGYIMADSEEPLAHAWNRVYLDGQWKYVDVTLAEGLNDWKRVFLISEGDMIDIHKCIYSRLGY